MLTGATVGVASVLLIALGLRRGIYSLDIRTFFKVTSIILVVFAAGLFGYGVHELIEAGEEMGVDLGILSQEAYNINPADKTHILHEKGAIGSILKALVLYDGNPEVLRVIVYVAYWAIIGAYLLRTYGFGHPKNTPIH